MRLQQLTPVANGYAKLAFLNEAGSNGITSVAVAPAGSQVQTDLMTAAKFAS